MASRAFKYFLGAAVAAALSACSSDSSSSVEFSEQWDPEIFESSSSIATGDSSSETGMTSSSSRNEVLDESSSSEVIDSRANRPTSGTTNLTAMPSIPKSGPSKSAQAQAAGETTNGNTTPTAAKTPTSRTAFYTSARTRSPLKAQATLRLE